MMTLYSRLTFVSVVAVVAIIAVVTVVAVVAVVTNEATKTIGFIQFNVSIKDDSQIFVPGYRLLISAYHPEMVIRL